ncbi:hypothetical protein KUTeg_009125 [Tegillarca granosa]|uniref:Conserved oligomeric Golgi complex subunit 8 n=1 Tax=Tegillarca granosa TaxID=220873 RepID=A0ABQ9F7I0_TEGGR|nr:hypothetical protein KUTeg_009125 [Tegillarca granosa]
MISLIEMASIDVEDENILTAIFKDSFPDNWKDTPDFLQYLSELSSYGVEKLSLEPERLADEKSQILEETQNLAFQNYKTFIQTAECSREIFEDIIEKHVDGMLQKLPEFYQECDGVMKKAQEINSSRRMNILTLQRHTQLLEILEMPQLMDTCVRNGYYEEALELAAHTIVNEVKNSTQLMLNQLIQQLRTNVQLPACLRVIGYLRRMDVFTEAELRIKFLQARDSWFQGILNGLPKDDEVSRVQLFDIITQYRAIFSDEDPLLSTNKDDSINEAALFHGWVVQKVSQFLSTLEFDLQHGLGGRLDSILGQCMYFGLSFSRVGADFRSLLAPIFQRAAMNGFRLALAEANARFEENMQSFNLLASTSTVGGLSYTSSAQSTQLNPPTVLLDFYPLAVYLNEILTAYNELRLCAPVSLANQVAEALTLSLENVNRVIIAFHRAEETTFDEKERTQFEYFCTVYSKDLIPYLNKCLQVLFPQSQLAQILGVSVSELAKMGNLGVIDVQSVITSIDHLIPKKEEEVQIPESSSAVNQSKASSVLDSNQPNNIAADVTQTKMVGDETDKSDHAHAESNQSETHPVSHDKHHEETETSEKPSKVIFKTDFDSDDERLHDLVSKPHLPSGENATSLGSGETTVNLDLSKDIVTGLLQTQNPGDIKDSESKNVDNDKKID